MTHKFNVQICTLFLIYTFGCIRSISSTNFPATYTGDVFVNAGWACFSSKEYYVNVTSYNFIEALRYCESLKAALVEVETLEENIFLNEIMNAAIAQGANPGKFWVGLEYTPTGIFKWKLNGSLILTNLWYPGDPNGNWAAGETCARYIKTTGNFLLADNWCTSLFNVICERPMTSGVCECPNTTSSAITPAATPGMTCSDVTTIYDASTTSTVQTTTQGIQAPTSTDINTEELIAALTVDQKSTGKSRRTLISVEDKRFSAQLIGVTGVCCLVITFLLPILIDLAKIFDLDMCRKKNVQKR